MNSGVFIGVLLGICVFALLLCCLIFCCEFYRRSERWNAYGHKQGTKSRLRVLQRLRLHKPSLTTEKQQQGIPISLEMGSMDYFESYPLHPSGPVDFFSDPLSLDSEGDDTYAAPNSSHHFT